MPPPLDDEPTLVESYEDVRRWRDLHAPEIVGESEVLLEVLALAMQVAETDCSVVVTGETGTGKELFSQALHRASHRAKGPFVPINCAAIPAELMESEMFGHAKGAFTGAIEAKPGRFDLARGGTLFLDELGEMSIGLQSKLLRVIEERTFYPVGGSRSLRADVRIVAATNQNLEEKARDGSFRPDLYFRLDVVPIELPPLRARRSDIPLLVERYLEISNQRHDRHITGVSTELLDALIRYDWPGNVRELANLVERMVLLRRGPGLLSIAHLPPRMRPQPAPGVGSADRAGVTKISELVPLSRAATAREPPRNQFAESAMPPRPHASALVPVEASSTLTAAPPECSSSCPSSRAFDRHGLARFGCPGFCPGSSASADLSTGPVDLTSLVAALETRWLSEALAVTNGNKTQAAELVGLNRTTLVERLKRMPPLLKKSA
ncbi:MAG: sigma 54-interacting transcriptional regulator [Deltaproteobacteria bacterium]|nr:sigma 54-interacting transcriptional regulator [Deltaproteobacteria bacterium]